MVSFDVKSLFPSISMREALDYVKEWYINSDLSDEKLQLFFNIISTCMSQNYFNFNNKFYLINQGTSMGNPLSPIIADIFMGKLESNLERQNLLPYRWRGYVDDIWAVVKKSELTQIIDVLNNQYSSIQFTYELEDNYTLNFLDLSLTRQLDGSIDINIHRKETNTSRFITNDSFCPQSHKYAAFNSMTYRMSNLPLSENNFKNEKQVVKEIAYLNGFDPAIVDKMLTKHERKKYLQSMSTFFITNTNT